MNWPDDKLVTISVFRLIDRKLAISILSEKLHSSSECTYRKHAPTAELNLKSLDHFPHFTLQEN